MVSLTADAAGKVRELLAAEENGARGLRLYVESGGCAGLSYGLALDAGAGEGDEAFESHGVAVYVDPESLPLVDGAVIGYVDSIERTGFTVENPNAASGCGCGNSFQTRS